MENIVECILTATNVRTLWSIGEDLSTVSKNTNVVFIPGIMRGMNFLVRAASSCLVQWAASVWFSSLTMSQPSIKMTNVKSIGDVLVKEPQNRREKVPR